MHALRAKPGRYAVEQVSKHLLIGLLVLYVCALTRRAE